MRRTRLVFLAFVLFISVVQGKEIKTGLAQVDITPPVGYRMAGYFDERLSTGIHDPLYAKAFVFQDGKQKIAMVFCDLVGLSLNVTTNARVQASAKTGIPVTNIVIAATHSHTGPLFDDVRSKELHRMAVEKYGEDPHQTIDYPKFLIGRLAEAIEKANTRMEKSTLEVGIGKQEGLSFNRRYHMKNGRVAFNPGQLNTNIVKPAGPIDPDVGILFVRDGKKKPVGGVTVFATHADCVGGTEYCADYPFFISEKLKSKFGTNYMSAFAAGTCGDINHINVNVKEMVKGLEVADKIGTTLGETVLRNVTTLKKINKPTFAVRSETIIAPLQEVSPEKLAWAKSMSEKVGDPKTDFFQKVEIVKALDIAGKGTHWPLEVQVFRLDKETAVVGLPCEIFVELGLAIKRESPFKNTIVMTICNDRPSYVPTKKAFAEGSYEVTNARVKPGVGEMLVETAGKLLKNVKGE